MFCDELIPRVKREVFGSSLHVGESNSNLEATSARKTLSETDETKATAPANNIYICICIYLYIIYYILYITYYYYIFTSSMMMMMMTMTMTMAMVMAMATTTTTMTMTMMMNGIWLESGYQKFRADRVTAKSSVANYRELHGGLPVEFRCALLTMICWVYYRIIIYQYTCTPTRAFHSE